MSAGSDSSVIRRSYHLPECYLRRVAGRLRRLAEACEKRGIPFSYSLDRSYVATGFDEMAKQDFQCRVRIVEIEDGVDLGVLNIVGKVWNRDGTWEEASYEKSPPKMGLVSADDFVDDDDIDEEDGPQPTDAPECIDCGKSDGFLFVMEDETAGDRCHMCARCLADEIGGGVTMARDYAELLLLLDALSGSRGISMTPPSRRLLPVDLFVACCTVEVLEFGYRSGRSDRYDTTWKNADYLANQIVGNLGDVDLQAGLPRRYVPRYWERVASPERLDESIAEARQAIAWMMGQPADTKWTEAVQGALRRSMRDNLIEQRDEGLAASFVKRWIQHCRVQKVQELAQEIRMKFDRLPEETVGTPGGRVTVPIAHAVEIDKWMAPSGRFMRVVVALVTESGQILVWRTTPHTVLGAREHPEENVIGDFMSFEPGELSLTATVVRHEQYEGAMQTRVTRGALLLSPRDEENGADAAS